MNTITITPSSKAEVLDWPRVQSSLVIVVEAHIWPLSACTKISSVIRARKMAILQWCASQHLGLTGSTTAMRARPNESRNDVHCLERDSTSEDVEFILFTLSNGPPESCLLNVFLNVPVKMHLGTGQPFQRLMLLTTEESSN